MKLWVKVVFCGLWWVVNLVWWLFVFSGSHVATLDAKGRLSVPAKVRESLEAVCDGAVVMTVHHEEPCLVIYPEPRWQEILPGLKKLPALSRQAQRIKRLVIGHAFQLNIDTNGRLSISQTLRDFAGLDKKVLLVGAIDKLELWSDQNWNDWMNEDSSNDLPEDVISSLEL